MANDSSLQVDVTQFTFDLDSQTGVTQLLASVRASEIASDHKNELRDLIFLYTNGGRDQSVRITLEQKIQAYGVVPVAPVSKLEDVIEKPQPVHPFGTSRPAPIFPVGAATPVKVTQSNSVATQPESEPEPAASAPVATPTPEPTPQQPVEQTTAAAPVPSPGGYDPNQTLQRIREIKSLVNDRVGNPVNLVDIDNQVGREYMAALLDAMKKLNNGTSALSAMRRLEEAYQLVSKTLNDFEAKKLQETSLPPEQPAPVVQAPQPAPSPQPVPVQVTPPAPTPPPLPTPAPVQVTPPAPTPTPAPQPAAPTLSPTPKPAPAPQPVSTPSAQPIAPKPAPEVPVAPKQEIVEEHPSNLPTEKGKASVPEFVPTAQPAPKPQAAPEPPKPVAPPEPAPVSVAKPMPAPQPPVVEKPKDAPVVAAPVAPAVSPSATAAPASHKVSSLAQSETKLKTLEDLPTAADLETSSVEGDPLFTKEVDEGLQQLLSEWSLFKKSGLFGTGPKGREHPLFLKVAGLQIPLLLAGRFEGATQEVKQSITDYMNGWRYEQGIIYTQGETFEHYLRRVIRQILDLQKRKGA